MKTKVAIALALLAALSIAACSDNDESKPKPEPTKQKYTLADSYVMPTSLKFFRIASYIPTAPSTSRYGLSSPDSKSLRNLTQRLSTEFRAFTATRHVLGKQRTGGKKCADFLGQSISIYKGYSADDSWGNDYPKVLIYQRCSFSAL